MQRRRRLPPRRAAAGARGADVIKFASTGGVNSRIGAGLGKQLFDDEARAIVETAHMYGKKVAAHAHGDDGIELALRAGVDSIEHGTLMEKDTIALFRKTGAWYVPTLSTVNGYKERLAKNPEAYTGEVRREDRMAHRHHRQGTGSCRARGREDRLRHRRRRQPSTAATPTSSS